MAARTFLSESNIAEGLKLLLAVPENGESAQIFPSQCLVLRSKFSIWLEEKLLTRLQSYGDFLSMRPVVLGSWSRHELTPKSDIDLLFLGQESEVGEFTRKAFQAGVRLRARTPESANDWTVGVEPFDILALKSAVALNAVDVKEVERQRPVADSRRLEILKAIKAEREERRHRQDSISNLLEPNLKSGTGGLRDIEQALAVRDLFAARFAGVQDYPFQVLKEIKEELLYLRCLSHLLGAGDVLSAHDQLELATRLNFHGGMPALMKHVQSQLERASFYADWVVSYAELSKALKLKADPSSLDLAIREMKDSRDSHLTYRVRLTVDRLVKDLSEKAKGQSLYKALFHDVKDEYLLRLYRSRVLEVLIPDFKKLRGLVQHDHYHRFTADAHLVQTLREVQRGKRFPKTLGPLKSLTSELGPQDWWILKLTALFHDLAKGRKGDHATEGAGLVRKYFAGWEFPGSVLSDVEWLVQNHLLLSTAAFRQNPQAPATWKRLFERGVEGRRLVLLALFTAFDIRATNPEAWTDWKAKLLMELVQNLRSPQALSLGQHLKFTVSQDRQRVEDWLLKLDPFLLQSLTPKSLIQDLLACAKSARDLAPKVVRSRGRVWIRFHRKKDEKGVFLELVHRLFGLGLNVQVSAVTTLEGIGVYDWFCVRTARSSKQLEQWLSGEDGKKVELKVPHVKFQSVNLMSKDAEEWVLSFRGRDQRGLLLAAAFGLVEEGLNLRWARVHTWGQQVDDIFGVQPFGEAEKVLSDLQQRFVT